MSTPEDGRPLLELMQEAYHRCAGDDWASRCAALEEVADWLNDRGFPAAAECLQAEAERRQYDFGALSLEWLSRRGTSRGLGMG